MASDNKGEVVRLTRLITATHEHFGSLDRSRRDRYTLGCSRGAGNLRRALQRGPQSTRTVRGNT